MKLQINLIIQVISWRNSSFNKIQSSFEESSSNQIEHKLGVCRFKKLKFVVNFKLSNLQEIYIDQEVVGATHRPKKPLTLVQILLSFTTGAGIASFFQNGL